MDQNPFPNVNGVKSPIAHKLVEFAMSGEDGTVSEAIRDHQGVLLAIAGAIGQLEIRLAELESKAAND